MVEQPIRNRQVVGSTPTLGSRILPFTNQGVEGSSRRGRADFESIWVQYLRYTLDRNTLRIWNCVRVNVERCFYI